jgi:DHA3 family tetracycline resistance protein-like MFS transporter
MRRSMESSSDPGSRRAYRLYLFLRFCLALPAWVVIAVYLVREANLDPLQLVLMGTVMEAAVFLCEIPTGVVADLVSRRLSLGIAWLLQGGAWALAGATTSFGVILAAWVVWGIGATFESGAFQAWITDEVGTDRVGRVFVRGSQASLVGSIVGVLASFAIATVSIRAAIYGAGAVTAAMGLVALLFMPETGFTPAPRGERTRRRAMLDTALSGARLVRRVPTLMLLVTATIFVGAASEGFDRLSEAHLLRNIGVPAFVGFDPLWWFAVLAIGGTLLALAASNLLVPRVTKIDAAAMARTLFVLSALQIVAGLSFALTGWFAVAVGALWMLSLARTLVYPVYATWLNRSIDDSSVRATVNSIANQADAIGETVGGPIVGVIGNVFSLPAALVTSSLFYVPLLGLYGRAARSDEPLEAVTQAVAPVR